MTRSAWIAGLAGVICLAIFFRGYQLTSTPPGLFFDEAANGTDALHALHTGTWAVFYPQNGGREGLFINLQSLLLRATGVREPWVLRSASAAFGVLTVLGLALLGKELLGKEVLGRETALIAAFFMSVSFWHVNFSRIGLRAISAPFFLTWALFLLLVSCRVLRKKGAIHRLGLTSRSSFWTWISYIHFLSRCPCHIRPGHGLPLKTSLHAGSRRSHRCFGGRLATVPVLLAPPRSLHAKDLPSRSHRWRPGNRRHDRP